MPDTPSSRFRTTHWSLILAAAGEPTDQSRSALSTLCQTYWNPVYVFIRRSGYSPDQSQDLTQSFFTILLEKNYLGDADRRRGRFRAFLLTAVKHFLANEWDRANALKRGGGLINVSIDSEEAEANYVPGAVDKATPESIFERQWAWTLLERVMMKLREKSAETRPITDFDRLAMFLAPESGNPPYETVASEMGISAGALRMIVYRMRREYQNLLYAEIAETVSTPEEIDDEIRFLLSAVSG